MVTSGTGHGALERGPYRTAGMIFFAFLIAAVLWLGLPSSAPAHHQTYCGHGTSPQYQHSHWPYRSVFKRSGNSPWFHAHTYEEQKHYCTWWVACGWKNQGEYTKVC